MDVLKTKGQVAGGVAENLLVLLVIVAIAFVTIRVAASLDSNIESDDLSDEAGAAKENFSAGLWDAYQLMSLAPYLIGALVVIALVVGFARLVGVGRL
jgi:hypothetical protein